MCGMLMTDAKDEYHVRHALSDRKDECHMRHALGDGKDECHVRRVMPHVPALSDGKVTRWK